MEAGIFALKNSLIPEILVIGGSVFIFVAVIARITAQMDMPKQNRVMAAVVGVLCVLGGTLPYVIPEPVTNAPNPVSVFLPARQPGTELMPGTESVRAETPAFKETGIYQTAVEVKAWGGWQRTGVYVQQGTQFRIDVMEGEWTPWGGRKMYDEEGDLSYICTLVNPASQCPEPIPGAPIGRLIGRVADKPFELDTDHTFTVNVPGELELRINDADGGLFDNSGQLTVRIEFVE